MALLSSDHSLLGKAMPSSLHTRFQCLRPSRLPLRLDFFLSFLPLSSLLRLLPSYSSSLPLPRPSPCPSRRRLDPFFSSSSSSLLLFFLSRPSLRPRLRLRLLAPPFPLLLPPEPPPSRRPSLSSRLSPRPSLPSFRPLFFSLSLDKSPAPSSSLFPYLRGAAASPSSSFFLLLSFILFSSFRPLPSPPSSTSS